MKNIVLVLPILLCAGNIVAQIPTTVSGELRGTVNWSGTILVKGDVTVAKNSQLNIAAGTRVLFAATGDQLKEGNDKTRCELNIRGIVVARGQSSKKIVFTSAAESPRMGDWYGIQLLYSEANNFLEYCQIEYAHTGVTVKNSQGQIVNSEFRYNFNAGIVTEIKSNPVIRGCIISENGYAGMVCDLGASPILAGNLITQNPIGVILFSTSKPNLGSLDEDANYNQGENRIINNEQYEVYNHSNQTILAQNNSWGKESGAQIDKILYDYKDNSKYGAIRYEPVYRQRSTRSNIEQYAALTRATVVVQTPSQPAAQAGQPPARTRANENDRSNVPASTSRTTAESVPLTANQSQAGNNQSTTVPNATPDNSLPETITVASAAEVKSLNTSKGTTEPEAPAPVLDYSQVFLEVFIDGGKKEYIKRPKLEVTNILRNFVAKGEVRVKVNISPSGDIESTSILKGLNEILDKAVLETVNQYKYKPGRINGQPVRFTTTELFRFE
jgi:TonB family protein